MDAVVLEIPSNLRPLAIVFLVLRTNSEVRRQSLAAIVPQAGQIGCTIIGRAAQFALKQSISGKLMLSLQLFRGTLIGRCVGREVARQNDCVRLSCLN